MHSVRSIKLSLKYHRFTPSGLKAIGIEKFEFVTKTQFLCCQFVQLKIGEELTNIACPS